MTLFVGNYMIQRFIQMANSCEKKKLLLAVVLLKLCI
jgi:hypothetical protein